MAERNEKVPIVSDTPVDEDFLGWKDLVGKMTEFTRNAIATEARGPVVGIYGSFGTRKTTFAHLVANGLSDCQIIWFHPTFYSNEGEVAAAFFESALKQIQVESKGLKRIRVKFSITTHKLDLLSGVLDILAQVVKIIWRLFLFIGLPLLAFNILTSLTNLGTIIVGLLGGAAVVIEQLRKALEPGLNINAEKFVRKIQTTSPSNVIESYVREFQWVARLSRSYNSPLVVIVDSIDDGLPLQMALMIEALRLFGAGDIPCVFVILTDKIALQTAVRTRFLSQLNGIANESVTASLLSMADAYMDKVIRHKTELELPPADKIERYVKSLLASS